MAVPGSRQAAFWVPICIAVFSLFSTLYLAMDWIMTMFEIGRPEYPTQEQVESQSIHWHPPPTSLGSVFLPISFALGCLTFASSCIATIRATKGAKDENALAANWLFYLTFFISAGFVATNLMLSINAWLARQEVRASFLCSPTQGTTLPQQICTRLSTWRQDNDLKLLVLFLVSGGAALATGVLTVCLLVLICKAVWFPPLEYPEFPAKGTTPTRDVLQLSPYAVKAVQEAGRQYSSSTFHNSGSEFGVPVGVGAYDLSPASSWSSIARSKRHNLSAVLPHR
ncbi:hypothetical protein TGME49_310390 [Toxoplasma gondii ME49]|uniref:Transmembrane protein n=14 Tax=Toxoplasma gondii TaxID=5811 RepID=A0A125YYA1_TOXGG|nr:hypothetical protein TGME49_310390 [Toxoplasma gondii ME49]EPR60890.1 hypothetical protein TGGT1_310390 [Toxoplasma gondii GT1]ESS34851.1 putative transmembrane protein [Toxoplasma gondii VEG]KAF4639220.1 hypothetical protein TGRH88_049920 [Toxoplasma gondii]KFG40912.1 putative transmembrane protein [Toxoplasma gondii p89]KFG44521.1 putative transmembrane protein [Toxoplasma gondii GAB2-2007-GAL-DOM2]KFG55826.1 putative transmembrane protein [Toxoplasma gondii FOU]KFH02358.1 putative tran|eukprot:XP_002364285.1 hypothetical protein TGME49_310390 [Toxoplasma gondii ME49]